MKKTLFTFLILLVCSYYSNLNAQPPGPGGGNNPKPGCDNPPCVPIDGGISFLLLAGAALGSKKMYDLKKAKEDDPEIN